MSIGIVGSIIDHFHVVYRVGNEISEDFIIGFSCEFERARAHFELVIKACNEMNGTLAAYLFIELCHRDMVYRGCVAQFFEEWSLIVKTCSQAEGDI